MLMLRRSISYRVTIYSCAPLLLSARPVITGGAEPGEPRDDSRQSHPPHARCLQRRSADFEGLLAAFGTIQSARKDAAAMISGAVGNDGTSMTQFCNDLVSLLCPDGPPHAPEDVVDPTTIDEAAAVAHVELSNVCSGALDLLSSLNPTWVDTLVASCSSEETVLAVTKTVAVLLWKAAAVVDDVVLKFSEYVVQLAAKVTTVETIAWMGCMMQLGLRHYSCDDTKARRRQHFFDEAKRNKLCTDLSLEVVQQKLKCAEEETIFKVLRAATLLAVRLSASTTQPTAAVSRICTVFRRIGRDALRDDACTGESSGSSDTIEALTTERLLFEASSVALRSLCEGMRDGNCATNGSVRDVLMLLTEKCTMEKVLINVAAALRAMSVWQCECRPLLKNMCTCFAPHEQLVSGMRDVALTIARLATASDCIVAVADALRQMIVVSEHFATVEVRDVLLLLASRSVHLGSEASIAALFAPCDYLPCRIREAPFQSVTAELRDTLTGFVLAPIRHINWDIAGLDPYQIHCGSWLAELLLTALRSDPAAPSLFGTPDVARSIAKLWKSRIITKDLLIACIVTLCAGNEANAEILRKDGACFEHVVHRLDMDGLNATGIEALLYTFNPSLLRDHRLADQTSSALLYKLIETVEKGDEKTAALVVQAMRLTEKAIVGAMARGHCREEMFRSFLLKLSERFPSVAESVNDLLKMLQLPVGEASPVAS